MPDAHTVCMEDTSSAFITMVNTVIDDVCMPKKMLWFLLNTPHTYRVENNLIKLLANPVLLLRLFAAFELCSSTNTLEPTLPLHNIEFQFKKILNTL